MGFKYVIGLLVPGKITANVFVCFSREAASWRFDNFMTYDCLGSCKDEHQKIFALSIQD